MDPNISKAVWIPNKNNLIFVKQTQVEHYSLENDNKTLLFNIVDSDLRNTLKYPQKVMR